MIKTSTSGGPALAKGRVLSRAVLFAAMALATFVMIHRPTLAHQPKANSSHQTLSPVQSDRQAKARPAEQVYKNIQIFKGLTVEQVDGAMFFMAASLGVGCNHCHSAAWEGDDNPAKQSARRMVEMMRGINKQNYSSNTVITCYTCHRGSPDPPSSPDAGPDTLQRSGIAAAGSESAKVLPSAGTLLEKYYSAMGGQAAIAKVKTQVLLGTETSNETGAAPGTAPIRIYREQPSKLRIDLQDPDSPHSYWVTGKAGWIKDTEGIRALGPDDIEGAEGGPDFSYFLKLREHYPNIRVLARESVAGRDAFCAGATSTEGSRDKLYFDAVTGLLIRRLILFKTVLGSIPEVTDFEDYRAVNGVKLPFRITWSRPPYFKTRKFTRIKLNVPINGSIFEPPVKQ